MLYNLTGPDSFTTELRKTDNPTALTWIFIKTVDGSSIYRTRTYSQDEANMDELSSKLVFRFRMILDGFASRSGSVSRILALQCVKARVFDAWPPVLCSKVPLVRPLQDPWKMGSRNYHDEQRLSFTVAKTRSACSLLAVSRDNSTTHKHPLTNNRKKISEVHSQKVGRERRNRSVSTFLAVLHSQVAPVNDGAHAISHRQINMIDLTVLTHTT